MRSDEKIETGTEGTGAHYMVADASDEKLLAATAANHIEWMQRLARASHGTVALEQGVHWTYVKRMHSEVTMAVAEPPGHEVREHLDRVLDFCREKEVDRVGYWAFSSDWDSRLGTWLGARGFRWGGRPHWMAVDLQAMVGLRPMADLTADLQVTLPDRFFALEETELPCFDPDTFHVRQAMVAERPRRVWHAVDWDQDRPIAQVSICATPGELGICGLHDTVVVPGSRVKGVGAKRMQWVCHFVRDLGCRYLVTNAAEGNAPLFGVWGFRSLGFGQTWWLPGEALQRGIQPVMVALGEAIGEGDRDALESLFSSDLTAADLDAPLPNRMTPLQFAGVIGRSDSAEWLLGRGARPDVLAAWDLGWKAAVARLLETDLLNQQRPRSGKSLLHVAVERDDVELAELLLQAGIDTGLKDHLYGDTALEWARRLRRSAVAIAIKRAR